MTKRGIIQKSKHASGGGFEVTEQGLIRLQSFVPQYLTKRQWDNHLYLISYDIPSTASNKRDQFRRFLRNTGCGLLQESLWITPYNLQKFIDQFVKERSIPGTILVSKLGRDGAIGKESLETLLEQVYKLSDLNDRYALFLERFKYVNQPTASQRVQIALMYHKILKKDPQLPFELLPPGFLAAKAYQFYSSNIHQN